MLQTHRKYDRMAVRLSSLIARLMAGESLSLSALVDEFQVSYRTLRRDLRERLAYLDIEFQNGVYRLYPNTLKAYRDKDVLTFVRQTGMTRIFPGLDSRLLGLLLSQRQNAPCIIWHHAHRTSAEYSDNFYQLIYAITCHQQVVVLTLEQRFSPLLPYQFIYREGQWYLIAEYHQQVQVILLDDIHQVQLLSTTFKPRNDIFHLAHQNSFIAALPHFRLFSQLMVPYMPLPQRSHS